MPQEDVSEASPTASCELLPFARSMVEWLAAALQDYQLSAVPRDFVATASLFGALRHFNAICVLVEADCFASAFALLRVEWQALLNGAWLYSACPEEMLEDYLGGQRDFPKIPTMIKGIETNLKHEVAESGAFTDFQVYIGKFMHNHTHAGSQQLRRLMDERFIAESCTAGELNVLLFITTRMAAMAVALIAVVAKDNQLESDARERVIALSAEFARVFPDPNEGLR